MKCGIGKVIKRKILISLISRLFFPSFPDDIIERLASCGFLKTHGWKSSLVREKIKTSNTFSFDVSLTRMARISTGLS